MGRIGFVFSGQGDQFPGMGKNLYEKYASAKEAFDLCDRIRPGTSLQCFCGTEDELKMTRNTQPCLFAVELAAAGVLAGKGIVPDAAAGFSLGEVTAATVSGAFDRETGFRLVCRRGELMQSESEKYDTFMAAVLKLAPEKVQEICGRYPDIWPVNFNCPGQVTVSGLSCRMADFLSGIKEAGGRAVPLKVRGAFHSPLMKQAAGSFAGVLSGAEVKERTVSLYSDVTGGLYGDDVRGLLSSQICSPVQWEKVVRSMIADGVTEFIEIGPGKTLTNMIKRISPDVRAVSFSEYLAEVQEC